MIRVKIKLKCGFRDHLVGHTVYQPDLKRFTCRRCAEMIAKNPELVKRERRIR